MKQITECIAWLPHDAWLFGVLEVSIVVALIFAVVQDTRIELLRRGYIRPKKLLAVGSVKRGEKSWAACHFVFCVTSATLVYCLSELQSLAGRRLAVFVVNQMMLAYLLYWSPTFRNRIIGWQMRLFSRYE